MQKENVIYTYKYLWTVKGDKTKVNIKIVSDVMQGHVVFVDSLKKNVADLDNLGREYLHEYDCSKIGIFEDLNNI